MAHDSMKGRRHTTAFSTLPCPECRHTPDDYGVSHYPDCRYFWSEEERDDEPDPLWLHSLLRTPAQVAGFAQAHLRQLP